MRKIIAILFAWMCFTGQVLAFDTCAPYDPWSNPNPTLPCSYNGYDYNSLAVEAGVNSFFYKGENYTLTDNGSWWALTSQVNELCDGLMVAWGSYACSHNLSFAKSGALFFGDGPSYPGDIYFEFPVPQDKNGNPFNAYTAPVSSVMDQSTLGTGIPYDDSDHQVVSFEGEVGDQGPYAGSTCYAKSNGKAFGKNINYKGTSGTGGKYYLCYNGHPGYDYPFAKKTPIHAAMSGTLCAATSKTTYNGSSLWRDPAQCPLSLAGGTSWQGYHTFYMIHKGLTYNGSTDDYMTVYLHSNNLEASIQGAIINQGYAEVIINEHVADVGGYGPNGPDTYGYHLHFEMYKWNISASKWDRIDPYGDGVNNILWRH